MSTDLALPTFAELRDRDIKRYKDIASAMALKSAADPDHIPPGVSRFIVNYIFPVIEQLASMTEEVDDAVDDLIEESDDMLQPRTAATIGLPIMLGEKLIEALLDRAAKTAPILPNDPILAMVTQYRDAHKNALEALSEITLRPGDDEDEDDNDDDGDD